MELFEIKVDLIEDGLVKGSMPVKEKHTQAFGFLHGGASIVFAESLAGIGSMHMLEDGKVAAGVSVNSKHLKPKKIGGFIHAIAVLKEETTTKHIWQIIIKDDSNETIHISVIECRIVDSSLFK